MANPSKLYSLCSVLMASLFAYSASVQLNDPDWYFWFPLYACGCVINMVNWAIPLRTTTIRHIARLSLLLGIFLFIKVVTEDFVNGKAGFWSLDLSQRVVREKTGSGLVVISLILQLEASLVPEDHLPRKKKEFPKFVEYGMAMLVVFGYGLPFVFFVIQKGEMKF
ncbi:transmembrane protein 220 [Juglans microcarpa x Juglans regia]|uniref:transmembrane protein 220 n=1 Tax=Juglans microcarpa x Juglans regia TaxID=2249226 RepID=UPI001B7E3E4E|nr:transmembrane protein 220 [Juglans microcarpa x Juglans regia]